MKPSAFDYLAPTTVAEAVASLAGNFGDSSVIAGGQTLMPLLAIRLSAPSRLIDINRIAELRGVERTGAETRIGAATRQNTLLEPGCAARGLPALVEAVRHVGHHQTRNRGTVGGSVALGEPASELPATAVALGAVIEARSSRGTRRIPADEFYIGPYATTLEPDELLTAVIFPDWPDGSVGVFHEVARRPGDFALVGLVGAIALDQGRIVRAGLAWFAMGPTPMRARQAEAALVGKLAAEVDPAAIAQLALADAEPFDDKAATAAYRRTVGGRIFASALAKALNGKVAA